MFMTGLKQPPTLGMIWALSVTGSDGAGPLLMAGTADCVKMMDDFGF